MSASDIMIVVLAVSMISIFGIVLGYENWQEYRFNKKIGRSH
jgi:hypothetical protein